MSLYGSLFYEFKDDAGAIRSNYYTLFFLRRLFFILVLFVLEKYPIIQLCLCEIFTLTVRYMQIFWVIVSKNPFSERALNTSNAFTELGLATILPVMGLYLFNISQSSKDTVDIILLVLVNAVISSQMIASLYIFAKTVRLKIISKKGAKVVPNIVIEEMGKINKCENEINIHEDGEQKSVAVSHVVNISEASYGCNNFSIYSGKLESSRHNLFYE